MDFLRGLREDLMEKKIVHDHQEKDVGFFKDRLRWLYSGGRGMSGCVRVPGCVPACVCVGKSRASKYIT